MSDFACPGLLGSRAAFIKTYEKPIMQSRSVGCTAGVLADGQKKASEVSAKGRAVLPELTRFSLLSFLLSTSCEGLQTCSKTICHRNVSRL
jgi:DNA repair and recombination protein RAD54B